MPFALSSIIYKASLEFVACDIWGPSPAISNNQFQYYIHFLDVYSHFNLIFAFKLKSDTLQTFIHFKIKVENLLGHKIKKFQTDGSYEFQKFKSIFDSCGIEHRIFCQYTQEQNGLVERRYRHIVETGLTLMVTTSIPLFFVMMPFTLPFIF